MRRDLKYGEGQTYLPEIPESDGGEWNFKHDSNVFGLNVSSDLADAMKTNPGLCSPAD